MLRRVRLGVRGFSRIHESENTPVLGEQEIMCKQTSNLTDPAGAVQPEPLMTVKEVATFLNVSPATIYRFREDPTSGFPSAVRIGNLLRWRPEDMRAFVEESLETE